ncbi:hypothetical protein OBBRIDRAFT_788518 [Obba rivulosa]|uniref:Uncharacterized protein n=1 Tax=Obba rivulosa TaxID=1052685 RepID=A0A8E2DT51_9APHY|nr:hypothetical protein OBBRIDRAFT_788518 [Obba rivulosa]
MRVIRPQRGVYYHDEYTHTSLFPQYTVLHAMMTWVLSWPLELNYAKKYVKIRGLCCCRPNASDDDLYFTAAFDIEKRVGLSLEELPVLACWDEDELKAVYALCTDRKARSAAQARICLSRMPPKEAAMRVLAGLLQAQAGPKWYL